MPSYRLAQPAIEELAELTGRSVDVQPDPTLWVWSKTSYRESGPHPIRYQPKRERCLDWMVAHEVGHLRRYFSGSHRWLPASGLEHREQALADCRDTVGRLGTRLPPRALADLLKLWHEGLVSNLASVPADLWIERWIREQHPQLREQQAESIEEQAAEYERGLGPGPRTFTPKVVFDASGAVNAAYLTWMAEVVDRPSLPRPFYRAGYKQRGEELLALVSDDTYEGDCAATDAWATQLGVRDWFSWVAGP